MTTVGNKNGNLTNVPGKSVTEKSRNVTVSNKIIVTNNYLKVSKTITFR